MAYRSSPACFHFFFFQAEDGIRDLIVTGVQTCALPILNRLNELIPHTRHAGDILLEGVSVFSKGMDPVALRREVGMVFQQPNPFPKTIFDNVAYGPRLNGLAPERDMAERVERALRQAALWDEVKDRLHTPGTGLAGGPQQRLCIARALANEPEARLLDGPCSGPDPGATQRIEELLVELKQSYSILIVTHNMQQASRASDFTGFFYLGHLIEFGPTKQLDRKSTRLNSSHDQISYAVFCLK